MRLKTAVIASPAITRIAAAFLGIALLAWGGLRASRAGHATRVQLREAEQTLATFADWKRRYQPAVAAESIAWRRMLMEVRDLGVVGDERLALTQSISRAAEFAGLTAVRVLIQEPDTTGSEEQLSTAGVRRTPAPFGLSVECRGNLQAMVAFLGSLPPAVAPTSVNLARQDDRARHRVTLAVYEIELSNASPTSANTPVERGTVARSSSDRTGG